MIKFIFVLLGVIVLLTVFYLNKFYKTFQKKNEKPLNIQTFDGSNSPYHPSVKYNKDGFGGYEYIMAETPFYLTLPSVGDKYRDQFECPSLHYSHDGIHWEEIGENPIDKLTQEEIRNRDYFSDPDLVETPNGIECWYRLNRRYGKETNQENILLLRKISKDGVVWGERELIADLQEAEEAKGLGRIVISQGVIFEDGKYKCWYVDNIHLHKERICYSESSDATQTWSDKKVVKLNGLDITPWHLHVLRDGDIIWLTVYDHRSISLWKGTNETEFEFVRMLVTPCGVYGSFYSNNTYRACLTKISDDFYRMYFSADDMFRSYIGVMEGDTPETMSVIHVDGGNHSTFCNAVRMMIKSKLTIMRREVAYYSRRLWNKPMEMIRNLKSNKKH